MNDTLFSISRWFKTAKPKPTINDVAVQFGCVLEEVAELLDATNSSASNISDMAGFYKSGLGDRNIAYFDRIEMLDAMCDIIVTLVGVAEYLGMDIHKALAEVDRSNWSKFVDGKPIFDNKGKIAKGVNYTPPDIVPFVGGVTAALIWANRTPMWKHVFADKMEHIQANPDRLEFVLCFDNEERVYIEDFINWVREQGFSYELIKNELAEFKIRFVRGI